MPIPYVGDAATAQLHGGAVKEEPESTGLESGDAEPHKPKVIDPIYYDLEPSPTAESSLKARVFEERKKQLDRVLRFSTPDQGVATSAITETSVLGARRAAVRRGFATGFDPDSPDEERKRQARIARFGPPQTHPFYSVDDDASLRAARARRFGAVAMDEAVASCAEESLERKRVVVVGERPRPNVLHLFGVDDMATKEVVKHFSAYGPSWCEWLNDSSCNVAFEDAFSMRRSLRGMSIGSTPTGTPGQSMDAMADANESDSKDGLKVDDVPVLKPLDRQDVKVDDQLAMKDDENTMDVIGNADFTNELLFRPLRPFVGKGRFATLWGRMATEADVRPDKPNPQSKWSRTVHRGHYSKKDAKQEPITGDMSEPSTRHRGDSSSKNLGVKKDKHSAITKPLPRKSSKMEIDRALSSS